MIIKLEFENSKSISISALQRTKLQMFFKPSIGLRNLKALGGRNLNLDYNDPFLFY